LSYLQKYSIDVEVTDLSELFFNDRVAQAIVDPENKRAKIILYGAFDPAPFLHELYHVIRNLEKGSEWLRRRTLKDAMLEELVASLIPAYILDLREISSNELRLYLNQARQFFDFVNKLWNQRFNIDQILSKAKELESLCNLWIKLHSSKKETNKLEKIEKRIANLATQLYQRNTILLELIPDFKIDLINDYKNLALFLQDVILWIKNKSWRFPLKSYTLNELYNFIESARHSYPSVEFNDPNKSGQTIRIELDHTAAELFLQVILKDRNLRASVMKMVEQLILEPANDKYFQELDKLLKLWLRSHRVYLLESEFRIVRVETLPTKA
jgi:hypothetical protein